MSDIVSLIIASAVDMYNFTQNPLRIMFSPYITLMGSWFYGLFFGMIVGIIYSDTKNIAAPFIFLVILGTIGTVIFSFQIGVFFGLIGAFALTTILYRAFVKKGREF